MTEAVIELRFAQAVPQHDLEKAADRLKNDFPILENEFLQNVTVDAQAGSAAISSAWNGIKRSSSDRTDVVIFRTGALVFGHLAPYKRWEHVYDQTRVAWEALRRASNLSILPSRVGVRYINRIDIPGSETGSPFDYISFRPRPPEGLTSDKAITEYYSHVVYAVHGTEFKARVAVSTVPSPLVSHTSILLDIDVFRDENLPRRVDEIWHVLSEARDVKNLIFELCITERARELFDQ